MEQEEKVVASMSYTKMQFTLFCHDENGNIIAEIPCEGEPSPQELGE